MCFSPAVMDIVFIEVDVGQRLSTRLKWRSRRKESVPTCLSTKPVSRVSINADLPLF